MDKDTLKAIEIINEILGLLARDTVSIFSSTNEINTKRQDLYKIINDNND